MAKGEYEIISIPRLEQIPFLVHGFGTRRWKRGDFKRRPDWKNFKLVFLNQVHSDAVRFIGKAPQKIMKGDAMITELPSLLLIIRTADCLPLLIVDESRLAISAVHCGWRGTSRRLVERVVQSMKDRCGCRPSRLLVAIGPCIGQECYEVGEDVFQSFRKEGLPLDFFQAHPRRRKKYLFDLRRANLDQLMKQGVKPENVFSVDLCTHCEQSLPSFRRDKDKAGRMLSFIGKLY
jgi:YfiH family protein